MPIESLILQVLHLPIAVDSYVLAKHKNGKYYQAKVTRLKKVNFFKVNFKDNTWSDNLYAEDIIVSISCIFLYVFNSIEKV